MATMNQATTSKVPGGKGPGLGGLAKKFPPMPPPHTSAMVFIVKKGKPGGLKDWGDLAAPGVQIIILTPRTRGTAATPTFSAWLKPCGSRGQRQERPGVPGKRRNERAPVRRPAVTPPPSCSASGPVLITFECEAELIAKEFGKGNFRGGYP